MSLEQFAAAFNTPCVTIDADTAVGMVNAGFPVFVVDIGEQLTRDMVLGKRGEPFDFEDHTFAAPRGETEQYIALENLCEKLDSLNNEIVSDYGASIHYYAVDEFHAESKFRWSDMRSEWENIRDALLKGETKFIHDFLNDHGDAELTEQLDHYETTYLKERQEKMDNKMSAQETENKEPVITVSGQSGTNNSFDVTSVGFDTEKQYTVAEFNQALKKANEKWQENWDGLSYPNNTVIVTIENLHNEPCTYRVNLTDADYNSIQDIVDLSPTTMHASISTEKAIEILNKAVEHIPQQRDISHNTTNAAPTAIRGESRGKVMDHNTNFEVSTMSKLEGDGPAKAIATLVVNGEFAIHGVTVREKQDGSGLYASMPREKQSNGEYKDVVFPVTKEAREAINNAVLGAYEQLAVSSEQTLKNNITAPEKAFTKVYAQMHEVNSDKTQTKAAGQITLDSCLVITGVKLNEGTNAQGQTKTFVSMPAKPNSNGTYDDIAHPITADFHNTIDKSVMASVNNIGRYEYKGVKYEELGENPVKSAALHPKFADKLMAQLDKKGIPYQAKCAERTVITVAAENKPKFEAVKKELTDKLNAKDKPQQTQEQKQTTGTHSKQKK